MAAQTTHGVLTLALRQTSIRSQASSLGWQQLEIRITATAAIGFSAAQPPVSTICASVPVFRYLRAAAPQEPASLATTDVINTDERTKFPSPLAAGPTLRVPGRSVVTGTSAGRTLASLTVSAALHTEIRREHEPESSCSAAASASAQHSSPMSICDGACLGGCRFLAPTG